MEDRELVGLLYRADWTGLTLSGTVRGAAPVVDAGFMMGETWTVPAPFERVNRSLLEIPWYLTPSDGEGTSRRLVVAPGRRFRVESEDGERAVGSDGERMWAWWQNGPPKGGAGIHGRPRPPFRLLLAPSWLLNGYSLAVTGTETVCGRAGVRVLATPRTVLEHGPWHWGEPRGSIGVMPGLGSRKWAVYWDEVDAVVDAELGILLRCSWRRGDVVSSSAEFGSLDVGGAIEPSLFTAPTGSMYGRSGGAHAREPREGTEWWSGDSFGEFLDSTVSSGVREVAKTVAGMAAGGLGAVLRLRPSQNVDPFAQATAEETDPEASMPADEPDPDAVGTEASAGAVSDEVLDLLYRGGLAAPRFTATLHQWFDLDALLDAVPQAARGVGFGGVGFLVDAVRDRAEVAGGDTHSESAVRMGGWTRYRIDVTRPGMPIAIGSSRPRPNRRHDPPLTVASDGVLLWHVYADRAESGPARPAAGDLADLVDASWLLEFELSGGEEVTVGDRRAYRVVARSGANERAELAWWASLFLPAVAVVDAETGRLLRLTRFKGGRPVLRQELRDMEELPEDADFAFTPPPGVRVVDPEADVASDEEDSGSSADEWSWSAAAAAEEQPTEEEAAEEQAAEEQAAEGQAAEGQAVRDPARETADAIRKQVDETVAAARGFLESFFGGGRRAD